MNDGQECRARGVYTQRALAQTDLAEAVCLEQRYLEGVPAPFRPDGDQHTLIGVLADRRAGGQRAAGVCRETEAVAE